MLNNKFGIGIIGCGGISSSHARAYRMFPDDCDIIAVSDVSEASARRLMGQFEIGQWHADWRDLLADERIDVVSVCTPHYLHAPMTIAAAQAGKHVLCEKPMAMTVGEAHQMITACKAHKVKLSVGSERFNPRHRFIQEKALPEIGKVEFSWLVDFYYRDAAYYARGAWRGMWTQEGGGICVNQAIYTWDQWQWFLSGVDYAYGYWANVLHPTIEVEDIAYGLVEFKDGSHGKVFATSCCEWQQGIAGLRIFGENGEIWADDPWLYQMNFTLRDSELDAALHEDLQSVIDPHYTGAYQHWQVSDLLAAIREDRATLVPEAMEALKILNGIHWHGWNHAGKFKAWAEEFELPPSVEESKAQGWNGGEWMAKLVGIVKTPTRRLDAPFLDG
jgi:predicted dehydrogenase